MNKQNPDWSFHDEVDSIFWSLFCPSSEIYDQEDLMADYLDYKNNELNEYEVTTKSGRFEFCIKFAKLCISQETQALMIVITDLSERMKHRETEVSERMKTIMLWSLSHKIRSPLHQVNGMLSLIQPKLKDPEQLKYIKIANSSSELLRLKMEDILCYYKVETKTFKQCLSQFNVRYNWLILESLFMPLINSKKVKLRFFVEESTPHYIIHDSARIRGIIVNLIGNSIKYTKQGVISIIINWITSSNLEEVKNRFKIAVSDSGCGTPENKKRNLFKFLDPNLSKINSKNSSTPLAGTGLRISQKIALELGTKLEFKSTEGNGTSFWFISDVDKFSYGEEDQLNTIEKLSNSLNYQ